jgi:hypothetical protein
VARQVAWTRPIYLGAAIECTHHSRADQLVLNNSEHGHGRMDCRHNTVCVCGVCACARVCVCVHACVCNGHIVTNRHLIVNASIFLLAVSSDSVCLLVR